MIGSQLHLKSSGLFLDVTASSLAVSVFVLLCIALLAYAVATEIYRYKVRLPTLPGPPGFPIVGNLYQLAPDPAETLHQWGKRYGGVYQISLGTRPVVVFDSMQAARDVFVGQGHALIDKPRLYTFHSVLSSVASSIGTTAWSESTKRRRKTAASAMNKPAVASYLPFIDELTKSLISGLLEQGRGGEMAFDPRQTIAGAVTDLTMTVNYGARLPPDEALLNEIVDVEDGLSWIKNPLGSAQDFIPILRLLPFNSQSTRARQVNRRRLVYLRRFERETEERVEKGVDKPCIQGKCLRDPTVQLDSIDLMSISMSMVSCAVFPLNTGTPADFVQVSGGLDTMVNTLAWTIGTLAIRPDIQDKAYKAICEAYSSETWGPIEDEHGVPYIDALVKECLRTFSVLRLSLPRAAWKDIQYGDVFIPKGTTVFLNAWGCNRDETVFGDDADAFRPERFLDDPDLPHAAYGFGTRMCAGFHLANRQLYVLLLRLIWSFRVEMSKVPAERIESIRPLEVK
ncbi:hypothetical protein B0A54_13304 [Friedmanniomyces endolithicus]|uniref:Cytochrome P450 n=1 Tax=Friedmanniomyces endolithicus TaxID=329885 RepID=A0A4U0UGS1_9PEZI|nr:hypothetical protein B0A54_13304 [Friedmanniomyces endolithicus]